MKVTGIVLAGGRSTRMGTDKGLLDLHGKTFVTHVCEALKPIVGELIVVTNDERYAICIAKLVNDVVLNKGPVGGIYSGLLHSTTELNIVVSTDVPLVSTEILTWLLAAHDANFDVTLISVNGRLNPLIAVYNKSVSALFYGCLKTERLKLLAVIESLRCQVVEVPLLWSNLLVNINTKEDYDKLFL